MGISKFFQRSKDSRPGGRNSDKQGARDNRPSPTPTLLEETSSSAAAVPLQATEPPVPATPGILSATAHPITPPSTEDAPSLWNRAYEALRNEDPQLVDRYEKLLSRELEGMPPQGDGLDDTQNRIDSNPNKRHGQLKEITYRGLQRADEKHIKYTLFGHDFVLKDQVAQAGRFIQTVKTLVNEAVKVSPEASLAWAGVCVLLPVLTNPSAAEEANRDGLSYVTSRIRYYTELERLLWPENLVKPGLKEEFDGHSVELYQHILEFQIKTVLRFYQRWLATASRDAIRYDDWEGMLSKIKQLEQIVREESSTINTIASQKALQDIDMAASQHYNAMQSLLSIAKDHLGVSIEHRDISTEQLAELKLQSQILDSRPLDLPVAHEARYDSLDVKDSSRCESGTRTRIQERICLWADDDSGEPLFWLVGPAGTGKSTIARTIADLLENKNRLAAGYFFKRGEEGRNGTSRLFPTLASQLTETFPAFKGCLRKSLGDLDRDAVEKKGLDVQFNRLLSLPLADLSRGTSRLTMVIIIDALDECERPDHLKQVLALLSKLGAGNTICLRVLVTSRSTSAVRAAFGGVRYRNLDLETEYRDETQTDVATFLMQRFTSIKNRFGISDPWPDQQQLDRLIHLSTTPSPLFIYAATLCRFIDTDERDDPMDQLNLWLQQCDSNTPQLDQIYLPILHYALFGSYNIHEKPKPLAENLRTELFDVLGAVVLVVTPLSSTAMAALLGIPTHRVALLLRHLHAVLSIPCDPQSPVQLLHKSFSDFLLSPQGSDGCDYGVDATQTHAMLAAKCIQRMEKGLKQDICDIRKHDVSRSEIEQHVIDKHIPADLRYACVYWVYHLQRSKGSLGGEVPLFLYKHLLHWLEALVLLGRFWVCAVAINQLLKMCQQCPNSHGELHDFIKDAEKVIANFGPFIRETPLQIYKTLILFSPVASKVRQNFWDQRPRDLRIQGVKSDWNTHDAERGVIKVISPDSQTVVSSNSTLWLWDTTTGVCRQVLEGHRRKVTAVTFSPDGQIVASASWDWTVRLWDTTTGICCQVLEGHRDRVTAVAFSPDGQIVASASWDWTVRLWDTTTDVCRQVLEGHRRKVTAVAFSPDGQTVASASNDETVRCWDVATGMHRQTLSSCFTRSLAFSPSSSTVLLTDFGALDLLTTSFIGESSPPKEIVLSPASSSIGLSPDKTWIVKGGEKVVWLPRDYTPWSTAVRGSAMFVSCSEGHFLRIVATMT